MKAREEQMQKVKIRIRNTSLLNDLINELKLKTNILSVMVTTMAIDNSKVSDLE